MSNSVKTRFAPSPTGYLHLGNLRTALMSALYARGHGGRFLLRIEDSDRERSQAAYVAALQEDLLWLDLDWQEGPQRPGEAGPYFQSERESIYQQHYQALLAQGQAYPCFCSEETLAVARKAQLARGEPPRYGGRCRHLSAAEREARIAAGEGFTLRFRVPDEGAVAFTDTVRGAQQFRLVDIGDFIIRRADGSAAFFFCNAVDDALMGVTQVLRGEDHLTNTPRQILILEALGLPVPAYGHLPLITGDDGAPLSKRNGSRSLRELRAEGYLPAAITNYLARLGHTYEADGLLALESLAQGFQLDRVGRAPARFDAHQLLHWQQLAVAAADWQTLWAWLGAAVHEQVPAVQAEAFVSAIRGNILSPQQGLNWAQRLFVDPLVLDGAAREAIAAAGAPFFQAALAALDQHGIEFKAFADGVKASTGAKGKALFMPLRLALTGEAGGPEMARILPLLGVARARQRLAAWA